jgi:hypothetical protein
MLIHFYFIVKQEIAKEGVVPYGLFLQQNINLLSMIFGKKTEAPPPEPEPIVTIPEEHQPIDESNGTIPGQSPFEPIPVPALLLHCFFTWVLIFSTWGIDPPQNAYPLLIGTYLFRKYIPTHDERFADVSNQ